MKLNEVYKLKEDDQEDLGSMDPTQRDRIIFAIGKKPSLSAEEIATNIFDRAITRSRPKNQKYGPLKQKAVDLMIKAIKSAGPITDNSKLNQTKTAVADALTTALGTPQGTPTSAEIHVDAQGSAFDLLQKLKG